MSFSSFVLLGYYSHMELPYISSGDSAHIPVLFLHGILGCKEDWKKIIPQFDSSYFCISVDLPGHGEALFEENHLYHLDQCSSALVGLLKKLNLKKVVAVGYSMGGRIALNTAIKFPDYFQKLILESTSPGLKNRQECKERLKQDEEWACRLEKSSLASFLDDWYTQSVFLSLHESPNLLMDLKKNRLKNSPKHLAKAFRHLSQGVNLGMWSAWSTLSLPSYLFVGTKDEKFVKIGQEMHALNSESALSIIPQAGHNIHLENTSAFCYELRRALIIA